MNHYSETTPVILKKSYRFGKNIAELLKPALPNIECADHESLLKFHAARTIEGVLDLACDINVDIILFNY